MPRPVRSPEHIGPLGLMTSPHRVAGALGAHGPPEHPEPPNHATCPHRARKRRCEERASRNPTTVWLARKLRRPRTPPCRASASIPARQARPWHPAICGCEAPQRGLRPGSRGPTRRGRNGGSLLARRQRSSFGGGLSQLRGPSLTTSSGGWRGTTRSKLRDKKRGPGAET